MISARKCMCIVCIILPASQKTLLFHMATAFRSEAPRLKDGASRSLIIFFRYMPLDPAYKAGSRGMKPVKV
jgi:hypothetical protein